MSEFFNSIKQGLTEAIQYSESKCPKAIVHQFSSIDVKNIRSNLGMTQIEFASAFGISDVLKGLLFNATQPYNVLVK